MASKTANEQTAMLDKTPERVIAYFQDRRVRYDVLDFIVPQQ